MLAGYIDNSIWFNFSDGPNSSVIAKLYRLDYAVNESAKVMQLTKVTAAVDTIPESASKKMNGGNNRILILM
ncbi:MAG: hypothetical protein IPM95_04160 [Sphingobacteriales bacterium]|nr:hypothetical protein [Sphingobacteriales bacterium]